jgi:catechol 2,3-dioxygenase-like lactoylglutathione lyase family enzyme
MITGFHHTSFTVSDVEAAERFFVELSGLQRKAVPPKARAFRNPKSFS